MDLWDLWCLADIGIVKLAFELVFLNPFNVVVSTAKAFFVIKVDDGTGV